MKLVELFCGAGGFSRGAHSAGFEISAAYDLDETLTSSFERNFPNTLLRHRDVSNLQGAEIAGDVSGEITGLIGGPPCQGFSSIGRREVSDPRRLLLGHFFRLVAEIEPSFFVMENVLGLTSAHSRDVLAQAMQKTAAAYNICEPLILNAADFGAATSRRRVFVIGLHRDFQTTFEGEMLEQWKRPAATVHQAIADLHGAERLGDKDDGFDHWRIKRRGAPSEYARSLRSIDGRFTGHRITDHSDKVIRRFSEVLPGKTDKVGRHHRLKWDGQCPTLRAGTGSDRGSYQSVRPIHPVDNRVITAREAARLQGFPDDHVFHPTTWHSFRMIGNSVSPIVGDVVLKTVAQTLKLNVNEHYTEAAE
ncbi:DNA cytosine methyltransferase [Qipengyuania sp. NPDC077563]|uniref:DNA cytosine methyltransferase n=1 Tax=Qipengyuania sp. NPDC077563 TaxID=3364497 RepID=UPI00384DD1A3